MLRLAASLERIPPQYKAEIGEWLFGLLERAAATPSPPGLTENLVLWTLARLGARQPFHGSAHDVVAPDVAGGWLQRVMALDWKRHPTAPFAAAHLGRLTGDRSRDLPPDLRDALIHRLEAVAAPAEWVAMVREARQLDEAGVRGFLGESLPPGLRLLA